MRLAVSLNTSCGSSNRATPEMSEDDPTEHDSSDFSQLVGAKNEHHELVGTSACHHSQQCSHQGQNWEIRIAVLIFFCCEKDGAVLFTP